MSFQDYYEVLGVSRNASKEEIKKAYRRFARESHPDVIRHLPPKLQAEKEQRMYEANEAYEVLGDKVNREQYDRLGHPKFRQAVEGAGVKNETAKSHGSYADFFNELFGKGGVWEEFFGGRLNFDGGFWNTSSGAGIFGYGQQKSEDHFLIPENDWGLLVALKKAYESKEDGKWRVKKSESDKRGFVPEEIYSIKRENGQVYVFRKIDDWLANHDRGKPFKVRKEGNYWEIEKEIPASHFLGEYYLSGKGKDRLDGISYEIPYRFGSYLDAMKSLALKFAKKETDRDDKFDVGAELAVINGYAKTGAKNVRIEGNSL